MARLRRETAGRKYNTGFALQEADPAYPPVDLCEH